MGLFVIKKTPTGGYNYHFFAENKVTISVATQVYSTKAACIKGVQSVIRNAPLCVQENKIEDLTKDDCVEVTCPKFQIYLDQAGLFRFRLIATNGENISICEMGYKSKQGCMIGINSVANNAANSDIRDETGE